MESEIDKLVELPIIKINPSAFQPREIFAKEELEELAESIKENGLLNPIHVRKNGDDTYQIIAGERSFRDHKTIEKCQPLGDYRSYINLLYAKQGIFFGRIDLLPEVEGTISRMKILSEIYWEHLKKKDNGEPGRI